MGGIDFIICGLEHTGTTLVSELFRQIPGCDSGFECGILLAEEISSFKNFEPFYSNLINGWKISDEKLNAACESNNLEDFYEIIYDNSLLFDDLPFIRFDKTPRYISQLENIYSKLSVPVIVTCKSIESIAWSDYKRSKYFPQKNHKDFLETYIKPKKNYLKKALNGYKYALSSQNCYLIHLEDLCFNAYRESVQIFNHCKQIFKTEYFVLNNKRFKNTRGKSIDISVGSDHLVNSSKDFQELIRSEFKDIIDEWPVPKYSQDI